MTELDLQNIWKYFIASNVSVLDGREHSIGEHKGRLRKAHPGQAILSVGFRPGFRRNPIKSNIICQDPVGFCADSIGSDRKDSDNFRYESDRDYLNPMGSCQAGLTWVFHNNKLKKNFFMIPTNRCQLGLCFVVK